MRSLARIHLPVYTILFLLVTLSSGCKKESFSWQLPIPEAYTAGTAQLFWNNEPLDLLVRAERQSSSPDYAYISIVRLLGGLQQEDVHISLTGIWLEATDTMGVKQFYDLDFLQDTVSVLTIISEGDVALVNYSLDTTANNWVFINDWNPETEKVDISFNLNFIKLEQACCYHPLGATVLNVREGRLQATVKLFP